MTLLVSHENQLAHPQGHRPPETETITITITNGLPVLVSHENQLVHPHHQPGAATPRDKPGMLFEEGHHHCNDLVEYGYAAE